MENLPVRNPYLLDDDKIFTLPEGAEEKPDYYSLYKTVYMTVNDVTFYEEINCASIDVDIWETWGYFSKITNERYAYKKYVPGSIFFDECSEYTKIESRINNRSTFSVYENSHVLKGTKLIEFAIGEDSFRIVSKVIRPTLTEAFILTDDNTLVKLSDFISSVQ